MEPRSQGGAAVFAAHLKKYFNVISFIKGLYVEVILDSIPF
jgi:hypothetical protein